MSTFAAIRPVGVRKTVCRIALDYCRVCFPA
jgi:hypothetical protein